MSQPINRQLFQELISSFCLLGVAAAPLGAVADPTAKAGTATPLPSHNRVLGLTGAPNFRDIGGYATDDVKHVRWGAVYRSNALSQLTPADAARVDSLRLMSVIDLRTQEERDHFPSVWLNAPQDFYVSPKATVAPLMAEVLANAQTAPAARAEMMSFYARMPDLYHDEYGAFFRRVAAGKLPILVHCTAGKDRTGVAVAVLLRSVGVPLETVVSDYELTDKLVPAPMMANTSAAPTGGAANGLTQLPEESRVALWQSNPQYIRAALDSIDREYGSVTAYLSRGLQLSDSEIAAIRTELTQ